MSQSHKDKIAAALRTGGNFHFAKNAGWDSGAGAIDILAGHNKFCSRTCSNTKAQGMKWREENLAEGVRLICGDCREILPTLGKVDAVVTDPPYGMSFKSNHSGRRAALQSRKRSGTTESKVCLCNIAVYIVRISLPMGQSVDIPKPRSLVTWVKITGQWAILSMSMLDKPSYRLLSRVKPFSKRAAAGCRARAAH